MHEAQAYHFVGLDIHKRNIAFCEKDLTGQTVAHGTIAARTQELIAFAQSRGKPWVGGIEATLFSGWVYDVLAPYAVELHVGHPARLKALSKNKNDRIDAELLANLLRADLFPSCHMAPPQVRELRRVLRYRNFLVIEATRMKNKASGLLMEVGVEYAKSKLHGKKYFSELLDSLDEVPGSVRELLRMTRVNLEVFAGAQRRLLDALTRHAALRERLELLKSVGGVGDVTALTWALEIDDPYRFSSIKDAQSYCGLCSAQHESAGKARRAPLSKERNPHLQTILIEAAKLAPSKHPHLAAVHEAALERGYHRNRATLAVARKLAAYLLAVDKSGRPFVTPESQ
jgi:transposase